MVTKLFRKRKQLAGVSGSAGPINDGLVLRELRNFPEPLCSTRVRNRDDVRDVARSQTPADRKLHSFQQASGAPLFLEPVHGNRWSAVGRVPAAASLANGHVPDDQTLGCQREVTIVIHDSWPKAKRRSSRRSASVIPAPLHATAKRDRSQVCSQKRQAEGDGRNSR